MSTLSDWEENWQTDLGAWFPGEKVAVRQKELFTDFKHTPWMGVLLYSITGREFSTEQIKLFECLWSYGTSFPEAKLWNNRIGSIAGTARATAALGISAGTATSEALVFGLRPFLGCYHFFKRSFKQCQEGEDLKNIIEVALNAPRDGKPGNGKNRQLAGLPGFGRPITDRDERFIPILDAAKEAKLDGEYTAHLLKIEALVIEMGLSLRPNIASLMSALCLDQELTALQTQHYLALCFSSGILACQIDAMEKPEGCFLPLRCSRIHYTGPEERNWE